MGSRDWPPLDAIAFGVPQECEKETPVCQKEQLLEKETKREMFSEGAGIAAANGRQRHALPTPSATAPARVAEKRLKAVFGS